MLREKELSYYALDYALKRGMDQVRVNFGKNTQSSCIVLNNEVDSIFQSSSAAICLQLMKDGRYGEFSTNLLNTNEIEKIIDKAVYSLKLIEPDYCRTLPDKERYFKGDDKRDLGLFDKDFKATEPSQKRDIALNASEKIFGKDERLISLESEFGDAIYYNHIIDSQGFEGENNNTSNVISINCSIKGSGERAERASGFWWDCSPHIAKLNWSEAPELALRRAINSLNPKKLKSGFYNIIIEEQCASRVVAPIIEGLNGSNIQQNNSFLLNKKGEKIFSEKLNIIDDPHRYGAQGARWFNNEGIATFRSDIINQGVVSDYFISTYIANKMKIAPTVNYPSVPYIQPTESGLTINKMVQELKEGIIIRGFNGGNHNLATGDFSYGIEGDYFKNGEIQFHIHELNITGNIISFWNNLHSIADDHKNRARWLIPSLAFTDVRVSGE